MGLTIKEFVKKVVAICDYQEEKQLCFGKCPLYQYHCGMPDEKDVNKYIQTVNKYEFPQEVLEEMCICGYSFEENMQFCPSCGRKREKLVAKEG